MNFIHSRKYSKTRQNPNRNSGIALVSVLWVLLLLSGLAGTVIYVARVQALLTHRAFDLARASAATDAAVVYTVAQLTDRQVSRHPALGTTQNWDFDGIPTRITVSNESGRIDVNAASDELLSAFLQSRGVTADSASNMLAALRAHQQQTISPPAQTAGIPVPGGFSQPINLAPVKAIEELQSIPGWNAQDLRCWAESLTVYTGRTDTVAAPEIPGALAAQDWRNSHRPRAPGESVAQLVPAIEGNQSLIGEVIRIEVSATFSEVRAAATWVGRLTGDSAKPVLTLLWDNEAAEEPMSCAPLATASPASR